MWLRKPEPLFFTNSLTGEKEAFTPLKKGHATLYSCGPTVYGPVQIGNLRSFILADLVGRVLHSSGYQTKRVMNITDVGHLVGDGDEGEDKMAAGAKRDNSTPEAIAERYTTLFLEDISLLNIETDKLKFPRATDYIKENIRMVRKLEKKGFTYTTEDGVYFDTTKFDGYGKLGGLSKSDLRSGARVDASGKKHPQDFVLWRTAKANDLQQWDSPWGKGNPGWSIECSAMATKLLGERVDLHTGGEDLASIHHNNEIAQSECASGRHPFVTCWLHGAFLTANGEKLSKSLGNSHTLADITARGIHPLALRYLFLQAHYRSPLSFSFEALAGSAEALTRLWRAAKGLFAEGTDTKESDASRKIQSQLRDDLGTPQAIATLWEALGSETLTPAQKRGALKAADAVLGLSLLTPPGLSESIPLSDLPKDLQVLAREREEARKERNFARSDELRIHLKDGGYAVEDTPSGPLFTPIER